MRTAIDRSAFADAMNWVDQALTKSPAVPVLAYVPLRIADGKLTLSAFDYETGAQITVDAPTDMPGTAEALVSGRVLAQLAGALPRDVVYLETDEGRDDVGLSCGSSQWSLRTVPAEEYPKLPDLPAAVGMVSGSDFADAVARVAFAAGRDENLPSLAATWLELKDDRLTVFATDRYRIALCSIPWEPARPGIDIRVPLPSKFIDKAAKQMSGEAKISLAVSEDALTGLFGLDAGWRRITTRPYAADSPANVVAVLGSVKTSTFVDVDVSSLIEALKRISLVLEPKEPVGVQVTDGQIILSNAVSASASGREYVSAQVDGEDFETPVNVHFLLDALAAMRCTVVRIGYGSRRMFTFTDPAADSHDPTDYQHLLIGIKPPKNG